MKLQYIYLALLCFLSTSFIPIKPFSILNKNDNCQPIIDSAKICIQTSNFAVNTKPTIKDRERNLSIDKWLQKLSFKEMTCLLENEDISLKALGFIYAANMYTDSLLKHYSYLLADTTTIQLFMTDRNDSPKMKLGEVLSIIIQKGKEDKENFAKKPEIEKAVSTFIKQYSTYPGTYKPISFPYFAMGSDNEGLSDFKINHEYGIKNNAGMDVTVINAFVFDKNLGLNVIEKDSSSYIASYPPKLDYWLKEFGRKLTKNDSLTLKLR